MEIRIPKNEVERAGEMIATLTKNNINIAAELKGDVWIIYIKGY